MGSNPTSHTHPQLSQPLHSHQSIMKTTHPLNLTFGILAPVFAAALCFLDLQLARAATETWIGAGTNANWSDPGNWSGLNATPQAGDSLAFNGGSYTDLTNDL